MLIQASGAQKHGQSLHFLPGKGRATHAFTESLSRRPFHERGEKDIGMYIFFLYFSAFMAVNF